MSTKRLQALLDKRAALDAQIKQAQARQRAQDRKNDTRRKIIAGALALEHAAKEPNSDFSRTLLRLLETYVTGARERALMGLPPRDAESPGQDQDGLREQFGG